MEEMLQELNINQSDLSVPSSWSKDMIIRYFYVGLAPCFERDLNYFLASEEERKRQYDAGFTFKGSEVVCKTICDFYYELYSSLGIECQVIMTNKKVVPHFALIINGSKGWYYLDPLKDLFANQLGLKTTFFAMNHNFEYSTIIDNYPFLIEMTDAEIEQLDKATGLLPSGLYNDAAFSFIRKSCADNNQFSKEYDLDKKDYLLVMLEKINFAEKELINFGNIRGIYERKLYYLYLKDQLFNRREKPFVNIYFDRNNNNYCVSLDILSPNNPEEAYKFTECFSYTTGYSLNKKN